MQALGLELANQAFQKTHESTACNHLIESTTRRHHLNPNSNEDVLQTVREPLAVTRMKRSLFVIRMRRSDYGTSKCATDDDGQVTGMHRAYVALGSNVGDRFGMIELACLKMGYRGIHVVRTSGLYETKAMYVEDQPPFINGACEVGIVMTWSEIVSQLVP